MSEKRCENCRHHKFVTSSGYCDVSENNMSYSTVFEHGCEQWEDKPNIRKDCKKCIHSDICIFIEENPDCMQFRDRADLVEVVRCKDCIFYKANSCFNRQWDFESSVEIPLVRENDFCSYGERNENDR